MSITVPVDGSTTRVCYVINDKPIVENIDEGTSNEGEYKAVLGALYYLAHSGFKGHVVINSDSQLVVNQLSGATEVKALNLVALSAIVKALEQNFTNVMYVWSPKTRPVTNWKSAAGTIIPKVVRGIIPRDSFGIRNSVLLW